MNLYRFLLIPWNQNVYVQIHDGDKKKKEGKPGMAKPFNISTFYID